MRRFALVTIPVILGLGFLSGRAAGSGYGNPWFDALVKPSFMPPGWAFPVAWTALYILIALAAARMLAARASPDRTAGLRLFAAQFALNLAWSPLFFRLHRPVAALALILAMLLLAALAARRFGMVDRPAAWLMLPYLAWLAFAAILNAAIVALN